MLFDHVLPNDICLHIMDFIDDYNLYMLHYVCKSSRDFLKKNLRNLDRYREFVEFLHAVRYVMRTEGVIYKMYLLLVILREMEVRYMQIKEMYK